MFKALKKAQQGFTIIELLIVIAIIAILAGLVLNNFQGAQAKARDQKRTNNINILHTKLEEFYNENNNYPASFTGFPGMDEQAIKDADGTSVVINAAVADATAANAVANPGNTNEFVYVPYNCNAGACTGYILKSFIEKPIATTPNPYVKKGLNNT